MTVSGVLLIILTIGLIAAVVVAGMRMHRRAAEISAQEMERRIAVHATITADYTLISSLSASASSGLLAWEEALRHLNRDLSDLPHNEVVRCVLMSEDARSPHDRFMLVLRVIRSAHVLATSDLERTEAFAA